MPTRTMTRPDFRHFLAIPTRWMDNNIYDHINNVHCYSYFDTAVNSAPIPPATRQVLAALHV